MKETKDMTDVHTITDECGILGYAAATNPRAPEELTLTLPNGITILATARSLEEARAVLAIEQSPPSYEPRYPDHGRCCNCARCDDRSDADG